MPPHPAEVFLVKMWVGGRRVELEGAAGAGLARTATCLVSSLGERFSLRELKKQLLFQPTPSEEINVIRNANVCERGKSEPLMRHRLVRLLIKTALSCCCVCLHYCNSSSVNERPAVVI